MTTNIVRKHGRASYYLRVMQPSDISDGKKREIWTSLKTNDHAQARKRAPIVLERLRQEWDEIRRKHTLPAAEAETLIWERYTALIEADDRFRAALPTEADLNQIWKLLETEFGQYSVEAFRIFEIIRDEFKDEKAARTERLATLKADAAVGEVRSVHEIMTGLLAKEGLAPADTPEHRRFAQHLQRAEMEALRRAAERDGGDYSGAPTDPVVKPPVTARTPRAKAGERILELYDQFRVERAGTATDDTWNQNRKIVDWFSSFLGRDAHVSAITRKSVRDWKAGLFKWPVKAAEIAAFKGLSFSDVIKANEKIGKPTISEKTINKYLAALSSFASWLRSGGYLDEDVMSDQFLNIDKSVKSVFPYSNEQLKTIFASPLFTTCAGDGKESKRGDIRIRDWRFWLPVVCLYTGARLGEIAQMDIVDLRLFNGHWCFFITKEGAKKDKTLKTKSSHRLVPVHPELIRVGLVEHRAKMRAAGETKLFPGIEKDTRGSWSGVPSKFLNGLLRKIGVKTDSGVNVHSFRHTAIDAFRRAGYFDYQSKILTGHAKAGTIGDYGIEAQGDLDTRARMINAINYEGLKVEN